jgi:hypothetical protein
MRRLSSHLNKDKPKDHPEGPDDDGQGMPLCIQGSKCLCGSLPIYLFPVKA